MSTEDIEQGKEIVESVMKVINDHGHAVIAVTNVTSEEVESSPEDAKYGGQAIYKMKTTDAGFLYTVGRRASGASDFFFWLGSPENHTGFTGAQVKMQANIATNIINDESTTLDAKSVLGAAESGVYGIEQYQGFECAGFSFVKITDPEELEEAKKLMLICKLYYGQEDFNILAFKPTSD